MVRLNKFISDSGCCSRRQADELIASGKVMVNGKVGELGQQIDPDSDIIEIDGKAIKPDLSLVYYALYKPKGVVSTASDELGRSKVTDLVPKEPRVYPVGRLDADSEGMIILTNDGEITQKLTHPSFEHEKEYEVETCIRYNVSSIKKNTEQKITTGFTKGLMIDGKLMLADSVKIRMIPDTSCLILTLVLHTGYNRQIRKMCAKIGLTVTKLIRTRIGKLSLSSLSIKPGEYKEIKREDIL